MKLEANTYILTKLKTINPLRTYLVMDKWSSLLNKIKYNRFRESFNKKFGGGKPRRIDITKVKIMEDIKEDIKEFSINFNKVNYIFNTYHDKESVYYRLHQKNSDSECILIIVDKQSRTCEIHNISYDSRCMPSATMTDKKGSSLMKIALKLIDKIKDKYRLRYIQLTDNSTKICNTKKINLSIMLTLITGTTWYGKYDFYPKSKELNKHFIKNRKIMDSTLLKDIPELKNMIIKAHKRSESKLDLEKILKNYKLALDNKASLKYYLQYFLSNYDKFCILFYYFYRDLYTELKLTNMYGETFIKILA
jgi:hypothetical protein